MGSAACAGLTVVTDRPTDRPRYSVCSIRPHLLVELSRDIYIGAELTTVATAPDGGIYETATTSTALVLELALE